MTQARGSTSIKPGNWHPLQHGRCVEPEILDTLAPDDPAAERSRRDLQRIHRVMGTRGMLARVLLRLRTAPNQAPLRMLELGAGDGTLLLAVARRLYRHLPPVEVTFLDRVELIATDTRLQFEAMGWTPGVVVADVLDWAEYINRDPNASVRFDIILANLFLHHFSDQQLQSLFRAIATCSGAFFACEPRRSRAALVGSRLVGALGANAVTRNDALASVRAGFQGRELSRLWPDATPVSRVREYAAGLFSHCLDVRREVRDANRI